MTEEKQKFIELLAESGAVQFGDFTAKSGRKTPFFINTGNIIKCCFDFVIHKHFSSAFTKRHGLSTACLYRFNY